MIYSLVAHDVIDLSLHVRVQLINDLQRPKVVFELRRLRRDSDAKLASNKLRWLQSSCDRHRACPRCHSERRAQVLDRQDRCHYLLRTFVAPMMVVETLGFDTHHARLSCARLQPSSSAMGFNASTLLSFSSTSDVLPMFCKPRTKSA